MKYVPLSEQLRAAIAESGHSAHDIAVRAGISPPQLYRFLSGQRGLSLESLDKISKVLNFQVSIIKVLKNDAV